MMDDLTPIHTSHEHASTTMKVLLLIFAVILVLVLGYFVWQQNNSPEVTDNSSAIKTTPATTTKTPTTTADNTVACGDKAYAYSLTFDATLWQGHKVKEYTPANNEAIIYCYFEMPTSDAFWKTASVTNDSGYVSMFAVGVYTPAQWTAMINAGGPVSTELGHNASYYWGWSPAQAYPDTLKPVSDDVKNVVATFKIN